MIKNILFIFILAFFTTACNTSNTQQAENKNQTDSTKISGDLIIFHAGSLSLPFKDIKRAFNEIHPDVNILLEAAGSVQCARKITDLKLDCDIMASADYTVIDKFLIPDYTNWNIQFASNEMTIVYNENSRHSHEINSQNWYKILQKQDVAFGRSDPNSDPCGYRAVLVTQLAELYYKKKDLSLKILSKDNKYIRPKETDLLALLEEGVIDYIFLYSSVAQQHGLKSITLPDEINLKKTALKETYAQASVEINGKTPTEKISMIGEPMVYGVTAIKNSPNPKAALAFLDFLLSEKGKEIMEKNGQETEAPYKNKNFNKIPKELQKYSIAK